MTGLNPSSSLVAGPVIFDHNDSSLPHVTPTVADQGTSVTTGSVLFPLEWGRELSDLVSIFVTVS